MAVTFKHLFRPTVTENYPDEPPNFEARFRGVHVLQRDGNGLEKCVACFLCAAACPSNCIYIEAAENTETQRISAGERHATVYNIDYNRCIFCGYCVEACPPTPSLTGTLSRLPATTPPLLFTARSSCWRRASRYL